MIDYYCEMAMPWPPKELSPNGRYHWAVTSRVTKQFKTECWIIARSFRESIHSSKIDLDIVFCPPSRNRKRDLDNMLASCKAMVDGIALAFGLDDSTFGFKISRGEPVKGGAVIVRPCPKMEEADVG